MMASLQLGTLPGEIIDLVVDKLMGHPRVTLRKHDRVDLIPLVNLSWCSRIFHERIQPLLYKTDDARNAALRHGCLTGNADTIRKAVAGGAKPSVIRRHFFRGAVIHADDTSDKNREMSSLLLALRSNQLEAFRALLKLGAELNPLDYSGDWFLKRQLREFTQLLCQAQNLAFLENFIATHVETPHNKSNRSQLDTIFNSPEFHFANIVLHAPDDLIKVLLRCGVRDATTAVTAACSRGDHEIFNILVSGGAPITAHSVLVAIAYMGRTGDESMVEACLAGGARIPEPANTVVDSRSRFSIVQAIASSPLLMYLNSVPAEKITGQRSAVADGQNSLSLYEGVVYLVDTLGTKVSGSEVDQQNRATGHSIIDILRHGVARIPSPVELLLQKYGLVALESSDFIDTVTFLVERDVTGSGLASLFLGIDGSDVAGDNNGESVNTGALWQKVLTHLQPRLDALSQPEKNALLRRVIVEKGAQSAAFIGPKDSYGRRLGPSRPWAKAQAISRINIKILISSGADINDVKECTILHRLIKNLIHIEELFGTFLVNRQHDDPHQAADFVEAFGSYLSFLVNECGADPLIPDQSGNGLESASTAISTLEWELRRWRGGVVGDGLTHFVAVLKGQRQENCQKESISSSVEANVALGHQDKELTQVRRGQTQYGTRSALKAAEVDKFTGAKKTNSNNQLHEVAEIEEIEWNLGTLV